MKNKKKLKIFLEAQEILKQAKADLEWYGVGESKINAPKESGESNINTPASKIVYPANQAELLKRWNNYKEPTKEGSFKKADLEWYRLGATPSAMKNLQLLNGIVSLIKDDGVMKLSIQNPLSRSSLITMGGGTRAESFEKLNDSTKIKTNLLHSTINL